MKKALFCILAMVTCMGIFAQELVVVVAPFDVRSGFSKSDVETIEHLFLLELAKTKSIKVLDQSDAMFKENINRMQFELSDWSNPDKVAEFGKALNANAVVLGRMMMLGDEHIITARINTLNTEIQAANDMAFKNVSEIRGKLPDFTKGIVDRLPKPPAAQPPRKTYKIGDTGPGGGIVFSVSGNRYMECSGDLGSYHDIARAREVARNYQGGGFNNWRLPTQDELDKMYVNLKLKNFGGFSNTWYFANTIGSQHFGNGKKGEYPSFVFKSEKHRVRAVRAF